MQNCHFWNAKLALLECKTATFRKQGAPEWFQRARYPLIIKYLSNHRMTNLKSILCNKNMRQVPPLHCDWETGSRNDIQKASEIDLIR